MEKPPLGTLRGIGRTNTKLGPAEIYFLETNSSIHYGAYYARVSIGGELVWLYVGRP